MRRGRAGTPPFFVALIESDPAGDNDLRYWVELTYR